MIAFKVRGCEKIFNEVFHAYLAQKALETWGSVNPALWITETKDFDLIQLLNYVEITKGEDINDLGHDFMISNIDKMVEVLKEFMDPNGLNSNISNDAYKGWLFQGLESTKFYIDNIANSSQIKQYNRNSYSLADYYNQISSELFTITNIDCQWEK